MVIYNFSKIKVNFIEITFAKKIPFSVNCEQGTTPNFTSAPSAS
jgi:hypothetical protein